MGLNKLRSTFRIWHARVRVTPSRQTVADPEAVLLRCAECDWGRDDAPLTCTVKDCPRCGARLLEASK